MSLKTVATKSKKVLQDEDEEADVVLISKPTAVSKPAPAKKVLNAKAAASKGIHLPADIHDNILHSINKENSESSETIDKKESACQRIAGWYMIFRNVIYTL